MKSRYPSTAAGGPFYGGVFMVSGCLMALQIVQSRIFSVTTWYHLAFLVISIAMFGLTLAALHVHRADAQEQRNNYALLMAKATYDFGGFILIALMAQLLMPIVYSSLLGSIVTLPAVSFFTVLPYYQAGIVLSIALTRAPFPVARTYGIDLIGAAAGCLCALALMQLLDAPSAVLAVSLLAFAASMVFAGMEGARQGSRYPRSVMAVLVGAIALNALSPQPLIYPIWIKSANVTRASLDHDEWNAISRVTVEREVKDTIPYLWGPSALLPDETRHSFRWLRIDGDAGTPMYRFTGEQDSLAFLEFDVTTIAYALPGIEKTAIIGVGGGRDVLSAHHAGASDITALDLNDIQISLLREKEPFKSYAAISDLPGLKLVHSEARSWFSGAQGDFDLIQMSLIDTWAATGAGAFALSENGLYTVDAWAVFLDDLDEDGVFTVSRWYTPQASSETERLIALAVQALLNEGVTNPRENIFVATGGRIATLVLAKRPFSAEQLAALHARATEKAFGVLVSPDRESPDEALNAILSVSDSTGLERLAAANPFDISPPTDERPFFFNQVRLGNPWQIYDLVSSDSPQAAVGHAKATLNLYLILAFSSFMVAFAIVRPLVGVTAGIARPYVFAGTAWFMLIGLGFMLLEVALLQRMSIFLGHPVYSLSVVLFSLVLSTGLGSLLSDRMPLLDGRRRTLWVGLTALLAVALSFLIGPVFHALAEAPLLARALICILLAVPLGLLLGFGFPTGMALVRAIDERPSAWFWGINGAAGVMGSALAVALNIAYGLNWTIILGGMCYALLLIPSLMMARMREQRT